VKVGTTSNKSLPVMLFKHQKAWEVWLSKHLDSSGGVWLRLAKKSAELESVSYQEALEVALCHGWIDGQKQRFDEESWLQKFTPRGPKSIWSKINRAKALELIAQDRMRPAGLAAIERAKENGRWDAAYDSHRTAVPPADFQSALDRNPKAKAFFATLNSQNRYAVLFRIQTAKKAETRQKRIDQFVQMLGKHEKLYPDSPASTSSAARLRVPARRNG
jgi:uncharacterized protein YdeI (YjbR/CyaY-like superfamily)